MNKKFFTYLSYDHIAFKIDSMIEEIKRGNFTSIVVIVRGGTFPGIHISVRTGLPIYYLKYERNNTSPIINWIGSAPPKGNILLCEDLAGSGKTLINSQLFLKNEGYVAQTFVIFKDSFSASTPELVAFETTDPNEKFIVPWEKGKYNPICTFTSNDPLEEHEYEFTGWDLDGIFLSDVPTEQYTNNLTEALIIRDSNPLALNRPLLEKNDVIITGRPLIDRERTQLWLKNNEIYHPVHHRDDDIIKPTPLTVALWKGKKALEIGCTRYVESEAEQAMHIANHYPHLEVIWWNQGKPISIKASSFSKTS